MKLAYGSIPAIITAAERDNQYIAALETKLKRALLYLTGDHSMVFKLMPKLSKLSFLLYLMLTWLSGTRTLGEEYSGLLPVDVDTKRVPTWFLRALHVFFSLSLVGNRSGFVKKVILPLHLILFYYTGAFMDPVKRFLGIRYAQEPSESKNVVQNIGNRRRFYEKMLLFLTAMNASVELYKYMQECKEWYRSRNQVDDESEDSATKSPTRLEISKCPLCYSQRCNPCSLPCGHVFCLECIVPWIETCQSCPMCRESCNLKQLYTVNL